MEMSYDLGSVSEGPVPGVRTDHVMRLPILVLGLVVASCLQSCEVTAVRPATDARQRTIVMVWDGLRPDAINPVDTPRLDALRQQGVEFTDNHATYPTFTMMNAASFATGSFPRHTGFYGNTFWSPPQPNAAQPIPVGPTAAAGKQDYVDPVFTEDYAVLATLNAYNGDDLLLAQTLFKAAQDAGLTTLALGKSGSAYIQDLHRGGMFIDENAVLPLSLAKELQSAGFPLPLNAPFAFENGALTLSADNGNPTARRGPLTFQLPNGVAARDPTDRTQGAPEDAANKYMMTLFTQYVLPKKMPDLSVIWFRTPDNTEHAYGPGSFNYHRALASQDARLGELQDALRAAGLERTTNIIVVSDHAHSNVSGPTSLFPLRALVAGKEVSQGSTSSTLGAIDDAGGWSVSGDVRSADLLTFAGFKAFDGSGCQTSPMSGITREGGSVQPVRIDATGTLCGKQNTRFQAVSATLPVPVADFRVPASLPPKGIVVAANGGSDFFYVPGHDAGTVADLVRFLQSREEYGAVFVDGRYGSLPGTLPLDMINVENAERKDKGQPDVIAGFTWDARQMVNGVPGTEFESFAGNRGMHGSFSPIDVHNTLIAKGPGFKTGAKMSLPSGNVDLAPTVARLFGLAMPRADGRVLNEALAQPSGGSAPSVVRRIVTPSIPATGLSFKSPADPTGTSLDSTRPAGRYSVELKVKELTVDDRTYRYFDSAEAVRQ